MENSIIELFDHAKEVAEKFGYELTLEEYTSFYEYCLRKLKIIKKDYDYLPLLLKCEIEMYIQGRIVNHFGRINKMLKGESVCAVNA